MQENFYRAVYAAVRRIPAGKVATYGQIAMLAGSPRASRIVGGALHRNPEPGKTPCHRVVFRDGSLAPALPLAGRERSGHCWKQRGSPSCRTGGWIWPGTSGPAKMKRCNIG